MDSQYGFSRVGSASSVPAVTFDAGLRSYMLSIYNLMAVGLVITGAVSYLFANTPALLNTLVGPNGLTIMGYVVMFAPLAMAFFFGPMVNRLSINGGRALFAAFSAVMGASLSFIFLMYTSESIARTFFITAGTFAGVSLWGYTTRRDLTGMGHFMVMGLIGLIIASLVNLFMQSSALYFATSVIGVLVFTGLTAWDTQRLKEAYSEGHGHEGNAKLATMGALTLYMDFINLFLYLLRFLGNRNE